MKRKVGITTVVVTLGLAVGIAEATIDQYAFSWDFGETTWFRFASTEWIGQDSPSDSWSADVENETTVLGLLDSDHQIHATSKTVDGQVVSMEYILTDVTGTLDLPNESGDWTITGYVRFSAPGEISGTSCRTSSFNVTFDSNYNAGNYSDSFTIPTLSGSGTQACGGWASELNSQFALGSSGAYLYFNKFTVEKI